MSCKIRILSFIFVLALTATFGEAKASCDKFTAEGPAIVWGSTSSAQTDAVLRNMSEQITFYYQDKDPQKVEKILKSLNTIPNKKLLSSFQNQGAFKAISGFFMGVFIENPDLYKKYRRQKNTEDVTFILDDAFLVSPKMDYFLKKSQNMCLDSTTLDMYWGYFFATGDKRAVETLKTTANRAESCKKEGCARNDLISAMAAEWSLNSNAKYHPIVKEVLGK